MKYLSIALALAVSIIPSVALSQTSVGSITTSGSSPNIVVAGQSGKIVVNGVTVGNGHSVVILNGRVMVDGQDVTPDDTPVININIDGNIDRVQADVVSQITITGDAGSVSTTSGDVDVRGAVQGSISTMSGDVSAATISGSVSTMSGDIKR